MEAPLWLGLRALPIKLEPPAPTAAQETRRKVKNDAHTPTVDDPILLRLKNTMEPPLWLRRRASPTEPEPPTPTAAQEIRRKEKDDKHTPAVDNPRPLTENYLFSSLRFSSLTPSSIYRPCKTLCDIVSKTSEQKSSSD
ncbi:hypothetical protein L1987_21195 [Smallanthus sonchifolius]|uniref:Uncharacterized protein n=1 Tax=Smallanthus sonchifolius TaxID=185202 RepID=A0ACB9IVL0_9ASTR|nr:hypothetical protein L1987_21195 [Smallanthus sonchifolius]